jgi:uncharacterized protein YbjT (DUF2867 family)
MKSCVVAGASGLVGSALTRMLLEDPAYSKVHLLVRKELDLVHPKLVQHLADFNQLKADLFDFKVDDAYCTLGTTIAIAGSKEAFYKVDHDFVLSYAQLTQQLGASGFFVVSSMGASSSSKIFYNKVKGAAEEDLKKVGFPRLGIFRPSLLLGPRKEKRAGERFASRMMRSLDFMIPAKYKAIHVDQVAKKMVEVALQNPEGIYILESDQLH